MINFIKKNIVNLFIILASIAIAGAIIFQFNSLQKNIDVSVQTQEEYLDRLVNSKEDLILGALFQNTFI